MTLFQNPSSSLNAIVILTIIATAILGAVEANKIGIGSDSDITVKGAKRSGPTQWFVFLLLLWIVGFPSYLYWRSRYGRKNYLIGGIFAALLFSAVAYGMSSAIESKKSEIREQSQRFQQDMEEKQRELQQRLKSLYNR